MTGSAFIEEFGLLFGPIVLTNTHSVGLAHEVVIRYMVGESQALPWIFPVVAETYDGRVNDINGFHVHEEHVRRALESAVSGPVREGSVGGGTGMIAYGLKAGIGTASRRVGAHHVAILVQANHGSRSQLRIGGLLIEDRIEASVPEPAQSSSIIGVVATDAPLLPLQLKALCKRAAMGLARTGAVADMTSGDLFIAFSTKNRALGMGNPFAFESVAPAAFSALYEAAAQACEEAIINALVAAEPVPDVNGNSVPALPRDQIQAVFRV
jgi:D-aminopeptidase